LEELNEGLGDMLIATWEKHTYDFAHSVSGFSIFFDGVWARLGVLGIGRRMCHRPKPLGWELCEERFEGDL
jgi:hypothetical protein